MPQCQNCGRQMPFGVWGCQYCRTVHCSRCGQRLQPGADFCATCGASVKPEEPRRPKLVSAGDVAVALFMLWLVLG